MFINDDLSVTFGSSLNRPVYSGSLFCRLLKQTAKENQITKTALIVVGNVLGDRYERSELYNPAFTTEFRQASVFPKNGAQAGKEDPV